MKDITLYREKENCCGCGACLNICPKSAISLKADEYGFLYPSINADICISCGKCIEFCSYQFQKNERLPISTYAAMAKNDGILEKSASGGFFAALATEILINKGIVFGCALEQRESGLCPEHIKIENIDELEKIQGSKYVQSKITNIYNVVKNEVKTGRMVLFSGTPCQIAALYSVLGSREWKNLLTIDIICHGVPSVSFFQGYINELEKERRQKIVRFSFRDKEDGWGLQASAEVITAKGRVKKVMIPVQLSSYYRLFLESATYRESCYSCKYAGQQRVGDITIGDYWGIKEEHPEYLVTNGGTMDEDKGISCVLVNSVHGKQMLEKMMSAVEVMPSTFLKVAKHNAQLNKPSPKSDNRDIVLEIYKTKGYAFVNKWYYKKIGLKRYYYMIWNRFPKKIQLMLRGLLL